MHLVSLLIHCTALRTLDPLQYGACLQNADMPEGDPPSGRMPLLLAILSCVHAHCPRHVRRYESTQKYFSRFETMQFSVKCNGSMQVDQCMSIQSRSLMRTSCPYFGDVSCVHVHWRALCFVLPLSCATPTYANCMSLLQLCSVVRMSTGVYSASA